MDCQINLLPFFEALCPKPAGCVRAMLSREGGAGTGRLLVTRSSLCQSLRGITSSLEHGIRAGGHASWPGLREGETEQVGGAPVEFAAWAEFVGRAMGCLTYL